jgi:uncharacterized protein (DUF2147 family)
MKNLSLTLLSLALSVVCFSQTVIGTWKTIDDATGKPKSLVEIYEQNGKLYGKVIKLFREPNEEQNPICDKCDDYRKNQPVMGMVIISDMQLIDGYYQKGTICDPKNGKVYKCELWLKAGDNNKLELRGYWGFIYRTQTWIRVS